MVALKVLESRRIKSITDFFEPGSTFKIFLFSAALESGIIHPYSSEGFFCENGSYQVDDRVIHDYKSFGFLKTEDIFIKSSNIGCTKIIEKLSYKKFYDCISDFGFGCEILFPAFLKTSTLLSPMLQRVCRLILQELPPKPAGFLPPSMQHRKSSLRR